MLLWLAAGFLAAAAAPAPAQSTARGSVGRPRLVLLGDSTLDNCVWCPPGEDVASVLRKTAGAEVVNLAADAFTTSSLLHGGVPAISGERRKLVGDPLPVNSSGHFQPLQALADLISGESCAADAGSCESKAGAAEDAVYVILSIGGNDFVPMFFQPQEWLMGAIMSRFLENYNRILQEIGSHGERILLCVMLQYRPAIQDQNGNDRFYHPLETGKLTSLKQGSGPEDSMAELMEMVYAPLLKTLRAMRVPIIDMARSFDIRNSDLYVAQMEPSAVGGAFIARLIAHVVRKHNFAGPSRFYHAKGPRRPVHSFKHDEKPWKLPRSKK